MPAADDDVGRRGDDPWGALFELLGSGTSGDGHFD